MRKLQKSQRRRRHARGMTLIEIVVVIAILAMMGAGVAVAVIPMLDKAKIDTAKSDIRTIQNGLKMFYARKGSYPDTATGLKALVDAQVIEKITDPWDTEYVYMLEAGKPVVVSYGKDKAPGGADLDADISSKELDAPKK